MQCHFFFDRIFVISIEKIKEFEEKISSAKKVKCCCIFFICIVTIHILSNCWFQSIYKDKKR